MSTQHTRLRTPHLLLVLALSVASSTSIAATRPRYGGVLRVQAREAIETPDPPQSGPGLGDLHGAFTITRWEPGRRAVFTANDAAPGGRPFLDGVEIDLARPLRDQSIDLELGKADIVELGPGGRQAPARRVWSSSPVRLIALVFGPRVDDARVREALSLAVDRTAIHTILQRQGEITGALLPQWLSGYAFLFPSATDPGRARALVTGVPAASRALSLGFDDPSLQTIAERIQLRASREAGLNVSLTPGRSAPDVRLVEVRIASNDPARALSQLAAKLGLPEPLPFDSPEGMFHAERVLLDGFRVIPLVHLPDVYGAGPRVKGGPGIGPLGDWRFENLWLEGPRP